MPLKQSISIGDKFNVNCGSIATVVRYINALEIIVKTNTGYTTTVRAEQLRSGSFSDNLYPLIFGIGYKGLDYVYSDRCYQTWGSMLKRAYHKDTTYENCTVDKFWHNFSNFKPWYEKNYIDGYELDKDLRFYGNKKYSEQMCIFVPQHINVFFFKFESDNGLPFGVMVRNTGYGHSMRGYKTLYTIKEAQNAYWNLKYLKMQKLIDIYPEFKELLENYFEHFFGEHY